MTAQAEHPVWLRLRDAGLDSRLLGLTAALVAIWLALDLATDGVFLAPRNLYNLAVQSSVVGVMATGMVLVIVARHIDLSVGSTLGFTGMLIAAIQVEVLGLESSWSWPLSVVAGIGCGAAIGAWQGYWVAYRGVPAFVVTLGGLLIFRGAAYLLTDGRTVAPLDTTFSLLGGGSIGARWSWIVALAAVLLTSVLEVHRQRERRRHGFTPSPIWSSALRLVAIGSAVTAFVAVMNAYTNPRSGLARGIPIPVLVWSGVVVAMSVVARATRFGRHVFAIGGSLDAAVLCGVDVRRVTLRLFMGMGILSAIAAVITTARLGAGTNSMGTLAELSVIAAAVIGGTSLSGGRGSIVGAILGVVLMQSLENGMVLLGVSSALRQVVIGLVLIAAVWLDSLARGRGVGERG